MIYVILLVIIAAIGFVLIKASKAPNEMRASRSITINAPAAAVFPHVNTLKKWDGWSPWAKLDPNAKIYYEGPDAGVGSAMQWDGNMKLGKGKMTIVESQPDQHIKIDLDFEKPMKGKMTAEFFFTLSGNGTLVKWDGYGPMSPMGRIMSAFMNCETMMGKQYDKGLATLKSVVEGTSK